MPIPLTEILKQKKTKTYSASPDMTIAQCVKEMNDHNIGSVPVIDENDKILGIFTERDLLKKVIPQCYDVNIVQVKDVMTKKLTFIHPETSISEAMKIISTKRIRHLPIVENGKLKGLVSSGDITKWIIESQELLIDTLCDQELSR